MLRKDQQCQQLALWCIGLISIKTPGRRSPWLVSLGGEHHGGTGFGKLMLSASSMSRRLHGELVHTLLLSC